MADKSCPPGKEKRVRAMAAPVPMNKEMATVINASFKLIQPALR